MARNVPGQGPEMVALRVDQGEDGLLLAVHCQCLSDSELFGEKSTDVLYALPEHVLFDDSTVEVKDMRRRKAIRAALEAEGGNWAPPCCFCILTHTDEDGNLISAVGLGSNVKKRTRAGRLALAATLEIKKRWGVAPSLQPAVKQAEEAFDRAARTRRPAGRCLEKLGAGQGHRNSVRASSNEDDEEAPSKRGEEVAQPPAQVPPTKLARSFFLPQPEQEAPAQALVVHPDAPKEVEDPEAVEVHPDAPRERMEDSAAEMKLWTEGGTPTSSSDMQHLKSHRHKKGLKMLEWSKAPWEDAQDWPASGSSASAAPPAPLESPGPPAPPAPPPPPAPSPQPTPAPAAAPRRPVDWLQPEAGPQLGAEPPPGERPPNERPPPAPKRPPAGLRAPSGLPPPSPPDQGPLAAAVAIDPLRGMPPLLGQSQRHPPEKQSQEASLSGSTYLSAGAFLGPASEQEIRHPPLPPASLVPPGGGSLELPTCRWELAEIANESCRLSQQRRAGRPGARGLMEQPKRSSEGYLEV